MAHEEYRKSKERYPADSSSGPARGDYAHAATSYGKVIVVYSPKGGVGVTMVATNLAVTLHNPETPVVLVDGNMQFGDATVVLNERGKNSVVDLAPRADELDVDVVEDVLITHRSTGMKILAAPLRPEYAENVNGDHFAKILAQLRRQYSYVIVDAQSYLSDVILSAFDASSLVILLATQDIPAINNARLFLDLSEVVGLERDRIIFILNKYDKRISITPEAIGDNLRQPVALALPLDQRVVVPSVNRGVPFILNDKKRPISRSILDLAEMVRLKLAEIEAAHDE
jgi:pilus assembly protein CpaE